MTINAVELSQHQPHMPTQAKKITLFGEVLADIFPDKTVLGGAPYNVARHLRGFAQHPIIITRVGHDALSDAFLKELGQLDMDCDGVQLDAAYPTGKVIVHLEAQGHRFEIEPNQAYDHIDAKATRLLMLATKPDLAYFGTLAQRNVVSQAAVDVFISDAKCPLFLDMNLRPPWVDQQRVSRSLLAANILKLNDEELTVVAAMFDCKHKDDEAQAAFLMQTFNLDLLLITCGESGAWALQPNGEKTEALAATVDSSVVDTVGAGDGFSAVCMLGLLNDWPLETLLKRANQFAGAICQIRGAAPNDPGFYQKFLDDWI